MSNVKMIVQHLNNEETEIVTNRYNVFNENIGKLKAFSENLPKEAELPTVQESGGLFRLFNHKVTGDELNSLTESIQDIMIEQNRVIVRTIQEFNTIYDTFGALDKEYIQGILISLKAAEEANSKALKGLEGVQINQNEIKQIINQQKQVIQVLKKFKERIEKIEHLADVDKIFETVSSMQSNVKAIEKRVKALEPTVANLANEMKVVLSSQSVFQDNLHQLKEDQVKQFKTVKQLISNQDDNISKIEEICTKNTINNETLNNIVVVHGDKLDKLKEVFQDDILTLTEEVAKKNSEFDAKLDITNNEVTNTKINFENEIKELKDGIKQQAENISAHLETELSNAKGEITKLSLLTVGLSKKIKYTRVISFISITIICILVSLIISGVI